jgi:UDP-N-acetylglucosamine--N-acetylmuramyl-(pentapeptide) pyrophosphoryl-undecaprenol N-acetylglucosamine transferase
VLFAGGGTGGHLYPGIAVARELLRRDPSTEVSFVGTAQGIETRVVPRENLPLDLIRSAGLKGKSPLQLARGLALLPLSAADAWGVISRRRPDVVVGVGGYSSGPVLLLAALRGRPTLVLEQNAVPGFTNRTLARVVRAAAVNFADTLRFFPGTGFVAGNPVRQEFLAGVAGGSSDAAKEPRDAVRVLIFGGSQGAHAINVALVAAAPRLAAAGRRLAITHQTGERDLELVRDGYRRAGLEARVEPFLYEMDREMTAADLVVCRAGATTLAELAVAGRPSVLVPLPTAADDHQRKNAEAFVKAGAGRMILESELSGERVAREVGELLADPGLIDAMEAASRRLARADAAARIVDMAERLRRR